MTSYVSNSQFKKLQHNGGEMAQAINNIIGKNFGRLTVMGYTDRRVSRAVVWKCKCACGNITYMTHRCLKSSVSCGCYQKENCSKVGLIYNSVGREAYKNKLNKGKVELWRVKYLEYILMAKVSVQDD